MSQPIYWSVEDRASAPLSDTISSSAPTPLLTDKEEQPVAHPIDTPLTDADFSISIKSSHPSAGSEELRNCSEVTDLAVNTRSTEEGVDIIREIDESKIVNEEERISDDKNNIDEAGGDLDNLDDRTTNIKDGRSNNQSDRDMILAKEDEHREKGEGSWIADDNKGEISNCVTDNNQKGNDCDENSISDEDNPSFCDTIGDCIHPEDVKDHVGDSFKDENYIDNAKIKGEDEKSDTERNVIDDGDEDEIVTSEDDNHGDQIIDNAGEGGKRERVEDSVLTKDEDDSGQICNYNTNENGIGHEENRTCIRDIDSTCVGNVTVAIIAVSTPTHTNIDTDKQNVDECDEFGDKSQSHMSPYTVGNCNEVIGSETGPMEKAGDFSCVSFSNKDDSESDTGIRIDNVVDDDQSKEIVQDEKFAEDEDNSCDSEMETTNDEHEDQVRANVENSRHAKVDDNTSRWEDGSDIGDGDKICICAEITQTIATDDRNISSLLNEAPVMDATLITTDESIDNGKENHSGCDDLREASEIDAPANGLDSRDVHGSNMDMPGGNESVPDDCLVTEVQPVDSNNSRNECGGILTSLDCTEDEAIGDSTSLITDVLRVENNDLLNIGIENVSHDASDDPISSDGSTATATSGTMSASEDSDTMYGLDNIRNEDTDMYEFTFTTCMQEGGLSSERQDYHNECAAEGIAAGPILNGYMSPISPDVSSIATSSPRLVIDTDREDDDTCSSLIQDRIREIPGIQQLDLENCDTSGIDEEVAVDNALVAGEDSSTSIGGTVDDSVRICDDVDHRSCDINISTSDIAILDIHPSESVENDIPSPENRASSSDITGQCVDEDIADRPVSCGSASGEGAADQDTILQNQTELGAPHHLLFEIQDKRSELAEDLVYTTAERLHSDPDTTLIHEVIPDEFMNENTSDKAESESISSMSDILDLSPSAGVDDDSINVELPIQNHGKDLTDMSPIVIMGNIEGIWHDSAMLENPSILKPDYTTFNYIDSLFNLYLGYALKAMQVGLSTKELSKNAIDDRSKKPILDCESEEKSTAVLMDIDTTSDRKGATSSIAHPTEHEHGSNLRDIVLGEDSLVGNQSGCRKNEHPIHGCFHHINGDDTCRNPVRVSFASPLTTDIPISAITGPYEEDDEDTQDIEIMISNDSEGELSMYDDGTFGIFRSKHGDAGQEDDAIKTTDSTDLGENIVHQDSSLSEDPITSSQSRSNLESSNGNLEKAEADIGKMNLDYGRSEILSGSDEAVSQSCIMNRKTPDAKDDAGKRGSDVQQLNDGLLQNTTESETGEMNEGDQYLSLAKCGSYKDRPSGDSNLHSHATTTTHNDTQTSYEIEFGKILIPFENAFSKMLIGTEQELNGENTVNKTQTTVENTTTVNMANSPLTGKHVIVDENIPHLGGTSTKCEKVDVDLNVNDSPCGELSDSVIQKNGAGLDCLGGPGPSPKPPENMEIAPAKGDDYIQCKGDTYQPNFQCARTDHVVRGTSESSGDPLECDHIPNRENELMRESQPEMEAVYDDKSRSLLVERSPTKPREVRSSCSQELIPTADTQDESMLAASVTCLRCQRVYQYDSDIEVNVFIHDLVCEVMERVEVNLFGNMLRTGTNLNVSSEFLLDPEGREIAVDGGDKTQHGLPEALSNQHESKVPQKAHSEMDGAISTRSNSSNSDHEGTRVADEYLGPPTQKLDESVTVKFHTSEDDSPLETSTSNSNTCGESDLVDILCRTNSDPSTSSIIPDTSPIPRNDNLESPLQGAVFDKESGTFTERTSGESATDSEADDTNVNIENSETSCMVHSQEISVPAKVIVVSAKDYFVSSQEREARCSCPSHHGSQHDTSDVDVCDNNVVSSSSSPSRRRKHDGSVDAVPIKCAKLDEKKLKQLKSPEKCGVVPDVHYRSPGIYLPHDEQNVPGLESPITEPHEQSLYHYENKSQGPVYTCDVDICDESGQPVCSPVQPVHREQPPTSPAERISAFQWRHAPSIDDDSNARNLPPNDESVEMLPTLPPLVTCRKPLRLGLSRRQSVSRLHPYLRPNQK